MNTPSNAVKLSNVESFPAERSRRIPCVKELMGTHGNLLHTLEQEYPDTAFALDILSNPFVQDRELGSIRMDAYVIRHNWDFALKK